ncbi:pseudomurein-binding repeat-containing protein [Methanobacterium sp. MBAC-LM]|uniref:pseudomurein-binding repeat-containing protein n=1 Tax=Methanobacterium sp. MBAC-LM TaxID=3412034 RepID=UPI003C71B1FC
MVIGGGIITRKLLFAVLLISSLSLTGIAGASAADAGTAQTQAVNNSTVQEKANIQLNNTCDTKKSVATQNSTDTSVKTVQNTSTATSNASTNQITAKTQTLAQDTIIPSDNQATATSTVTSTNSTSKNSTVSKTNTQNGVLQAAAGETKVSKNFTVSQITDAAARVKAYIETNHKLPNYVTIGTTQVEMPEFLKLLTAGLLQINNGTTTSITLKDINSAAKPSESVKSGNITKSGYLDLAKRVNTFIDANGALPNYATSSLGKLNYQSLIYTFSKIMAFYKTNERLPSYVTVKPWSTVGSSSTSTSGSTSESVPASLQQYLKSTTNCQVTNSQIQSLAKSITSGKTSTYDKAVAIFNWVRDNIGYSFYYNTKYGAVGTLNKKTGNCVDTAHLLIALERAAGIPARYEHVKAKFTSGNWYGHVIAQVYVNGKWYNADATSSKNTFGVIKNWNTGTATYKGTYATLPF